VKRIDFYKTYAAICLLISFAGIGVVAFFSHWAIGTVYVALIFFAMALAAHSCAEDEEGGK